MVSPFSWSAGFFLMFCHVLTNFRFFNIIFICFHISDSFGFLRFLLNEGSEILGFLRAK
jgi:hypothetical protein